MALLVMSRDRRMIVSLRITGPSPRGFALWGCGCWCALNADGWVVFFQIMSATLGRMRSAGCAVRFHTYRKRLCCACVCFPTNFYWAIQFIGIINIDTYLDKSDQLHQYKISIFFEGLFISISKIMIQFETGAQCFAPTETPFSLRFCDQDFIAQTAAHGPTHPPPPPCAQTHDHPQPYPTSHPPTHNYTHPHFLTSIHRQPHLHVHPPTDPPTT